MSKAKVKKILMSMPKEEIIGMVLEMYDARKEAKEYLEYYWCNIFKLNFDTPFVNKGFRAFFDFFDLKMAE